MNSVVKVKDLCKSFQSSGETFQVFNKLNFTLRDRSSTALIGESGSGKTTLIHILAGLEPPTAGTLTINGCKIWDQKESERATFRLRNMAIIFQQYNLIPSLNVFNNITLHSQLISNLDRSFQDELIELLGLGNLLLKFPEEISGGQQQRVAIVRAILSKPRILLADEPTGNLDEENAQKVTQAFEMLLEKCNSTIVVATHSKNVAMKLKGKLVIESGKTKESYPG